MDGSLTGLPGGRRLILQVLEKPAVHPALEEPPVDGWDEGPPLDEGWHEPPADSELSIETGGDGTSSLRLHVPGATALGARFERDARESFWGFGVRSDAVERTSGVIENWTGEGPYQLAEYPLVRAITPRWAIRQRKDAAYYPVPWAMSSAGYGVLIDSPELSRFRILEDEWSVEVLSDAMTLRLFAGDSPADLLRRFTDATGRQPFPAAPWFLGPWCQTGHADLVPLEVERSIITTLRDSGAPISAVETHMRRLPAGAHEGRRAAERDRTRLFHEHGLASLTYLNPFVSDDYVGRFDEASSFLQKHADGTPYLYPAYIGGRETPLTTEGQLDFSTAGAEELFTELAREAIEDGHDGWMEDFGEYTPPDATCPDGETGARAHNTYPARYHRSGARAAERVGQGRPIARFARSGWTGAARDLPLVWGGDPTTGWGFDGLASALTQGISAGLSGIGFWGSDIGGFFTLGEQRLDLELLIRWIQLGALLPLMRTKAEGVAIPPVTRPQVWDPAVLPHWTRWAALHTQLSPYLLGAGAEYVETGLPLMRHLCLVHPDDPACHRDDQYMLGTSLLAAPVMKPDERERDVWLPPGRWVDLWRAARYDAGTRGLELGSVRVLDGPGPVAVPAPLDEAPLLVRMGAVIPLLPPDVWSLAAPRDENALRLLAFPEGETATRFERHNLLRSSADGSSWRLDVEADRAIAFTLDACLSFEPARVTVSNGTLDAWSFDRSTSVMHARFAGNGCTLLVRA